MTKVLKSTVASVALLGLLVLPVGTPQALAQSTNSVKFSTTVKRAKAGNAEAQLLLGKAYEEGKGVKRDFLAAANWYKLALRQGDVESTYRLARLVHRGGGKLAQSPDLAAQLYRRAAQQGHSGAQNWLGFCYQFGFGLTLDYARAVNWYRKSAEQGFPAAQNNLGMLYLSGKGVSQDLLKAAQLFRAAVKQRYGWAENNLGGLYEMGWGVRRSPKRAKDLYRSAAAGGNAQGKKNLKRLADAQAAADAKAAAAAAAAAEAAKANEPKKVKITID
ncbi:MAG: sel1 repeat family protein [Alphaproteobacteria bacterium]|nr:sel1 repeat family protein [Alphaproteobacteria bacterium]